MNAPRETLVQCLRPDYLHLVVLPTEACNFRCTYCFEDFALARMKAWVVRGVKRLIATRAPELSTLHLAWFGGEPLLARDIVLDVMQHAQDLARVHPGMRIQSDITTNAWHLDRTLFERLLGLGVTKYQISFDGPQAVHDGRRMLAGGGPTFERIWAHVLALREVPGEFEVLVRIHADRANAAVLPDFIDRCRDAFGGDARFVLFLKPLTHFSAGGERPPQLLDDPEGREIFAALQRRAQGPGALGSSTAEAHPVCYASAGNSFVVRADGRLAKCTVALSHPKNVVGRIHEDGTVAIDGPPMETWMRGLWSGKRAELLCPMMGLAET